MKEYVKRAGYIVVAFAIIFSIFTGRLFYLQIGMGDSFLAQSYNRIQKKTIISAPRGEITDRMGRPLVVNRQGYSIFIERDLIDKDKFNTVILNLIKAFDDTQTAYQDTFPITAAEPFTFQQGITEDKETITAFQAFLRQKKIDINASAPVIIDKLSAIYGLTQFTAIEKRKVIGVRYQMDRSTKGLADSYEIATDVAAPIISVIGEQVEKFPGIKVDVVSVREYLNDGVASNIIGRVGSIYADEYEQLKSQGYRLNDVVGKDGIEKSCEKYLRGQDGIRQIQKNSAGQVISDIIIKEPVPGKNIMLNIDIELQKVAQEALAFSVSNIKALTGASRSYGYDVKGAATVAVDCNTGEILALASYPTYNLSEYSKKFNEYMANPLKPLFNRPIAGAYPQGSTFKMLTGIAGLEEKAISPGFTYSCTGKYTHYESYQPTCYRSNVHGVQNVEGALRYSCNCFFFDVGRMLGISALNKYEELFGFGQVTGIELQGEVKGVIAGPENSQKNGKVWNPGDTIQASIGQSDNLATPLQLANYVATIANGGTRYQSTLIKNVKDYHSVNTVLENTPKVLATVPMSSSTKNLVYAGMRRVVTQGPPAAAFQNFPVAVAGKTGTAQVSSGSPNAVFVCYAPFEKPQIAIATVAENGGEGGYVSNVPAAIMRKYFASTGIGDQIMPENALLR